MRFQELLCQPERVDAVFFKVVTKNDDSGRHGVLIPKEAYGLFPEFPGFRPGTAKNYTVPIRTLWRDESGTRTIASSWKHYHRYPERRVTALRSRRLNARRPKAIVLLARHGRTSLTYECHVVYPADPAYPVILRQFGFARGEVAPGLFGMISPWKPDAAAARTAALDAFLTKFDRISAMRFVKTMRPGPTGVGFTFETLLGITENNEMTGDFMGMEVKTYRSAELAMEDAEKVNLFLKEPTWIDGLSDADRVRTYGYVDPNGRRALYSTVQINRNSHGLRFRVDHEGLRLFMQRSGADVAFWPFATLEKRLQEKHTEAVFVAALSRGTGRNEEFHYRTVTHCVRPSIDSYISLISQGEAMLELRMHLKPNGSVRNHGSGFRVKKNRVPMLYGTTQQYRPIR